jgi:hypothetical protein
MKISMAAACDVHQSLPLDRHLHTLVVQSVTGDTGTRDALHCQDPNCNRFYSPDRGYFTAKAGERPVYPIPSTLRCRQHNEPVFMYLMTTEKELTWACPQCAATQPYTVEAHAS